MKKAFAVIGCLCLVAMSARAQDEEETQKGFKTQNLFTGGSLTVSFFNRQTVLGANPFFGYKIANWVDAGFAFNFLYSSQRYYYEPNDKVRQTIYGPGIFTRLYPVSYLFAQVQWERNFSNFNYIAQTPSPNNLIDGKATATANSLLLGAGIAPGRSNTSNSFYYFSLLFDVLRDVNSPYVNVVVNPNNTAQRRIKVTPIIRAGFNIALFQRR